MGPDSLKEFSRALRIPRADLARHPWQPPPSSHCLHAGKAWGGQKTGTSTQETEPPRPTEAIRASAP